MNDLTLRFLCNREARNVLAKHIREMRDLDARPSTKIVDILKDPSREKGNLIITMKGRKIREIEQI